MQKGIGKGGKLMNTAKKKKKYKGKCGGTEKKSKK